MARPTSPILFSHNNKHASRAADISRLLDPAYSPSSSSSSTRSHAYVDHHGDLHDPDYRHFPIAHPTPASKSRAYSHYNMAARPRWELADSDALDIDDLDRDEYTYPSPTRVNPTKPRDSYTSLYSHPTYTYPYNYHQHPSPPDSFDSDSTALDECDELEFEGFVEHPRKPCSVTELIKTRRAKFTKDRKRRASSLADDAATVVSTAESFASSHHHPLPSSPLGLSSPLADDDTEDDSDPEQQQQHMESEVRREQRRLREEEPAEVWTPTCTQALRREWQAISLRFRFSLFRAQRRMKSRFQ